MFLSFYDIFVSLIKSIMWLHVIISDQKCIPLLEVLVRKMLSEFGTQLIKFRVFRLYERIAY